MSLATLARRSAKHPLRVITGWIVLLAIAIFAIVTYSGDMTGDDDFINPPESIRAEQLIRERMPRPEGPIGPTETIIVRSTTTTADDPAFRAAVSDLTEQLTAEGGSVRQVRTYFDAADAGDPIAGQIISADRSTILMEVTLANSERYLALFERLQEEFGAQGFEIYTVGDMSIDETFDTLLEEDLIRSEVYGLPVAFLVLIVILGALIAAGIPVVVAMFSITCAIGISSLLTTVTDVSEYAINIIVMIGLAVGIDYSLFIISRYREERLRGFQKLDAIAIASATTGKAVVFSGVTVMIALAGLLLIPITLFRSMGLGAITVVVMAVLASFTLIPAALGMLGDRINWPRGRRYRSLEQAEDAHGIWSRLPRLVMRRPLLSVLLVGAFLVALAIPALDMNRGSSDGETLPPGDIRTALLILESDFSAGLIDPLDIAIDATRSPEVDAAIDALVASLANDDAFGPVISQTWNPAEDLALIEAPLTMPGNDPEAADAIERLRGEIIPSAFAGTDARVLVGNDPAVDYDLAKLVDTWTPRVFAMVLGLSFLLLLLAFRSIVIPIKAIIMNLLSVGAAYGLMVLVFQRGYGADLLGFTEAASIETWVPIFLFCILFGLSMDYHVFLLSRIREHYDQTHDNTESVVHGLRTTARLITGAAIIMVVVFAAFATASLTMFQQLGFGLAVAIFLDATIIRIILVPATMKLLGDRNWYLPRWLRWLPQVHVEGSRGVPVTQPQTTNAD